MCLNRMLPTSAERCSWLNPYYIGVIFILGSPILGNYHKPKRQNVGVFRRIQAYATAPVGTFTQTTTAAAAAAATTAPPLPCRNHRRRHCRKTTTTNTRATTITTFHNAADLYPQPALSRATCTKDAASKYHQHDVAHIMKHHPPS